MIIGLREENFTECAGMGEELTVAQHVTTHKRSLLFSYLALPNDHWFQNLSAMKQVSSIVPVETNRCSFKVENLQMIVYQVTLLHSDGQNSIEVWPF